MARKTGWRLSNKAVGNNYVVSGFGLTRRETLLGYSFVIRYDGAVIVRETWLGILEILAIRRPDQAESDWKWVMEQLGLDPQYFVAVYEAIKEGRWRTAEDPGAYIKAAARRQNSVERRHKQRMGLLAEPREQLVSVQGAEVDGERVSGEEMLDSLMNRQERGRPARGADGVWRSAPGLAAHQGIPFEKPGKMQPDARSRRKALESFAKEAREIEQQRQAELQEHVHIPEGPERLPDWKEWAEAAGLSEWEKKVVFYKMSGIGREQALREQPGEEARRALQAAWKKFERTALERLRAAAPGKEQEEF
jgi:AraC-like DNA-binding protein